VQLPGLPDCWAPIVEAIEPTSKTIQRTANMIGVGASLNTIRDILMESGLSEYQVFLAVTAAELLTGVKVARLPSDYEACGDCGFDHDYEPSESTTWHKVQDVTRR
jgi:hypothetical protein